MGNLYEAHRSQLEQFLEVGDLAILFSGKAPKSTADAHYSFLPNKNFFYFSKGIDTSVLRNGENP